MQYNVTISIVYAESTLFRVQIYTIFKNYPPRFVNLC